MATKTNFLELTLPDNGEYVDNWDTVVNANFEDIDEYADELNTELVGTTGNITNLKGTAASLQDRIDAGLNSDGTPNLGNSSDFTNLENSKHYGVSAATGQGQKILDRLHFVENDMIACRFGEFSDRYGGTTSLETIAGLAKLAGFHEAYGTNLPSGELVPSVIRGFTPNSVVDGPISASAPYIASHISSGASTELALGGNAPTVYNVDGLWFEIADEVKFEIGAGGHNALTASTKHYIWASRNEADYNYSGGLQWYYSEWCGQSLGGVYQMNLRNVPTHSGVIANAGSESYPSNGSISLSTPTQMSSASALYYSLVRAGDILVVTSPTYLAGEYLIQSAAGTTLTIFGTFPVTANQSGITFHVERRTMPALGFTEAATPTAGRVVIGEFTTDISSEVASFIGYAYNGIHDTGWTTIQDVGGFPFSITHNLGAIPSQVDVFVKRNSDNTVEKDPTLKLAFQHVDSAGDTTYVPLDVRVPAFGNYSTATNSYISSLNPAGGTNLYHESDGSQDAVTTAVTTANSVRVIVRR